jgi:hypothetical protein
MSWNTDRTIGVALIVESRLEWRYLSQHLPESPLWGVVEAWKVAMGADLTSRRTFFTEVERRLTTALDAPVVRALGPDTPSQTLSLVYAFRLYDQALSHALGLAHAPLTVRAFTPAPGPEGHAIDTWDLSDGHAIKGDKAFREAAASFLVEKQTAFADLPEATTAAQAYREAEEATTRLHEAVERLRLTPRFPASSRCDLCSI